MSRTLTLIGTSNFLSATYFPPIELHKEHVLGLVELHTYNTIPNIFEGQNKFYYDDQVITIPTGAYEVTDIEAYLQNSIKAIKGNDDDTKEKLLSLKPNNNTLKCEIISKFDIDFIKEASIGHMLGFSKKILKAGQSHESDIPIKIIKVVSIRVECNVTTGAYYEGRPSHTLFDFSPSVEPGYSINIVPRNIIWLPINTSQIDYITLRLVDQDGDPVDFRGETIVIKLVLKPS